jgi:biofilm PGA synthesis N-glycosyltransferase PgaC
MTVEILFWLCCFVICYAYFGYAILLTVAARWFHRPVQKKPYFPTLALIIPVVNEETVIEEKLENSLRLNYPLSKIDIIVVSDGCTDRTEEVVRRYAEQGVTLLTGTKRMGKSLALQRAVGATSAEVLVFTDANAYLTEDSLLRLMENMGDPNVAVVGGAKTIVPEGDLLSDGESWYWRYESRLKELGSMIGSVSAVGELLAIRKCHFALPPEQTIIEDFWLSLNPTLKGYRSVYEPAARAVERASLSLRDEFQRRSRNAAGGWQAIGLLPGLLDPRRRLAWQLVSHRFLRWILVPFLLPLVFILNAVLVGHGSLYPGLFVVQVLLYGLALWGWGRQPAAPWNLPFYFCFMNIAAMRGAWLFLTGGQSHIWARVERR